MHRAFVSWSESLCQKLDLILKPLQLRKRVDKTSPVLILLSYGSRWPRASALMYSRSVYAGQLLMKIDKRLSYTRFRISLWVFFRPPFGMKLPPCQYRQPPTRVLLCIYIWHSIFCVTDTSNICMHGSFIAAATAPLLLRPQKQHVLAAYGKIVSRVYSEMIPYSSFTSPDFIYRPTLCVFVCMCVGIPMQMDATRHVTAA